MQKDKWLIYNELAWLEPIIAPPEKHTDETEIYCKAIKQHAKIEPQTLLHLASGAGINDYTFKKHFQVTGVDISEGMLEVARRVNPDLTYYFGDMRTVELREQFDAVAVPDALGYMTTLEDVRKVIQTADRHLKPGGVLLTVVQLKEEFRENNFAYTGSAGDVEVTVFENNYIPDPAGNIYEATLVYLVRKKGELEIYTDRHVGGLFKLEMWLDLFKEFGFEMKEERLNKLYEPYILNEGELPLRMFGCIKK